MAFFTAFLAVILIFFWPRFLSIAISNIVLNGIIIGTGLFGIGLCFYEMFKLLPEYRWLSAYLDGDRNAPLPPLLLRPVALMLNARPKQISSQTLQGFLDMIMVRFEDSRESVRYITNTLIFLGLLGTFWGLIITVGGFSELLTSLDFSSESVLNTMQSGLSRPLSGMATAFTSSLLGLAFSLSVGFLGLQVQLAQNAIFRELEDYLSEHTHISNANSIEQILPQINLITRELSRTVAKLDKNK
ncbi:MAG: hypothetical protein KBS86_01065 [Proteobacteria bacterium]|nr:hypothetical protein [Candidatus Enterousia scatequi]